MTPEERAVNIFGDGAWGRHIAAAIREAVKERDFEWWEKLCLVDVVEPTPEGVRGFVDTMLKYHEEEAAKEEREACLQIVERHPPWGYDQQAIVAEIRARAKP